MHPWTYCLWISGLSYNCKSQSITIQQCFFSGIYMQTAQRAALKVDKDHGASFRVSHIIRASDCHLHGLLSLGYEYSFGDLSDSY
jgi:hypothetical protein